MKLYLKHRILNLIEIKELTAVEYLDFAGKYNNYLEKHDFWELCFVEKGKIELKIEDKSQTLEEESLILIPPDKNHSYHTAGGDENKVFVICFQCFSQALRPLGGIKFDLEAETFSCMKKLISECLDTFLMDENELLKVVSTPVIGGQQMVILLIECLLINLLRTFSSKENSGIVFLNSENFYENLVDTVISFLAENVNKKLTLDEIGAKFSYSKSFLCKTFKNQTGCGIISYFNNLKVEEAKILLTETCRTVTAISYSLGFQEVKYFDYIFKKHTGLSPATFRQKNKKGEEK